MRWAEERLGYRFEDAKLLDLALTHRSASKNNNERLEFLGDAFLNFVIARRLFERNGRNSEGDLSRLRAALVNGRTLADVGRELAIEQQILMGPGELRSGGARRPSVLANTVEALVGAVLLDGGHGAAEACVNQLMGERFASLPDAESLKDAKTRLQEWLQARGLSLPEYTVESTSGEPHAQSFLVRCIVAGKNVRVDGRGSSRRRAEQDAAQQMLSKLISAGE